MTRAIMNSPIHLSASAGMALREALHVKPANLFRKSAEPIHSEFYACFPPTQEDRPSSGVTDLLIANGVIDSDTVYQGSGADLMIHDGYRGEYSFRAHDANLEAVICLARHSCWEQLPILLCWTPVEKRDAHREGPANCTLIDNDGEQTWSLSELLPLDGCSILDGKVEKARSLLAEGAAIAARARNDDVLTDAVPSELPYQAWDRRLRQAMRDLCDGQHELPLRAFAGRVHDERQSVIIDRLFDYSQHVAVLGLFSSGLDKHLAVRLVGSGAAGAYAGGEKACRKWIRRTKSARKVMLATTLPGGAEWTIWRRDVPIDKNMIPVVVGWDAADALAIPLEQRLAPPEAITIQ